LAHADVDELAELAGPARLAGQASVDEPETNERAWRVAQRALAGDLLERRGVDEVPIGRRSMVRGGERYAS
jgi:hypothetical protein